MYYVNAFCREEVFFAQNYWTISLPKVFLKLHGAQAKLKI